MITFGLWTVGLDERFVGEIEGLGEFEVVDAIKVGRCVLHQLDREIHEDIKGKVVKGTVNMDRRAQL